MPTISKDCTYAAAPLTARGTPIRLNSDAKGEQILYTNGKSVIMRNLKEPHIAMEYTEHTSQATVASISPSGYYVASGDVQGNIRIWDATQSSHILKYQGKVISGRINDISWDFESKRLLAVGQGKERFGHVFMFDSGSSVGEISGHSKAITACSMRPCRPARAVTCSDDFTVNFYHGAPYKFALSITDHSRFVHDVKFSPSGQFFASVGADGKIFLYDGSTGAKVKELSGHKGGIFSVNWSPDSTKISTASGDSTVKVWDIESCAIVNDFDFGASVDEQQVGLVWTPSSWLVSCSLNGNLNYLDATSGKVTKVLHGHSRGITALCVADDNETFYTGSYDGKILEWQNNEAKDTGKLCHSNQICDLAANSKQVLSCGMDDCLKIHDAKTKQIESFSLHSQPKSISSTSNGILIAENNGIEIISKGEKHTIPTTFAATCICSHGNLVAVGADDGKVRVYELFNCIELKLKQELSSNRGAVTCMEFSPDGLWLIAGDDQRSIQLFDVANGFASSGKKCGFHSARVVSLAWSPDSKYFVSGSLDTNICMWDIASTPLSCVTVKNAHQDCVCSVKFLDDKTIISAGQDAFIRTWKIKQ